MKFHLLYACVASLLEGGVPFECLAVVGSSPFGENVCFAWKCKVGGSGSSVGVVVAVLGEDLSRDDAFRGGVQGNLLWARLLGEQS